MLKKHLSLAVLVTLVWGVNFPITKLGLRAIDPFVLTGIRFALAALPLVFFIKRPAVKFSYVAAYGFIFGLGMWGVINYGIQVGVSPGIASLIIQLSVFFTMGWGFLLFKEKIRGARMLGAVLALIGLFNIFGTYTAGWLGGRMSKPRLLTGLYLLRAVVIGLFLWAPVTEMSAYLFGMAMGFLWLSTVPLTNGTVATLFGVRNLSMLGGIVFLFHQLGSFLGGWLGGVVYDRTGNYDLIWQVAILLSLLAAALNWPVRERPVARLQAQMEAA